jgi:hypothetical protein
MASKIAGPLFDEEIRAHIPPDPPHKEVVPPKDRAFFADPEKKQLLSAATKVEHLTESIGTYLHGIQLSQLNSAQKDELALLVAEVSPHPALVLGEYTDHLREELCSSEIKI